MESIIYSLPVSSAYRERGHNIPVKSGTLQNGYSSPKAVKPYILGHWDYVDHAMFALNNELHEPNLQTVKLTDIHIGPISISALSF